MKNLTVLSGGFLVGDRILLADHFISRLTGLIPRRNPLEKGEGLLLQPCSSIHGWFMKFPIDVLYLSRDGTILARVDDMKPWSIGPIVHDARSVLELPAGTSGRLGLSKGDRLTILS
jgi:uncharacterized protein